MNGLDIARHRIAEEAKALTGLLDLGRLGLNRLPDELFELTHLRFLNLGMGFVSESNKYIQASANIAPNQIQKDLDRLVNLPVLVALFLQGMKSFSDLTSIHSLEKLMILNCRRTSVSDLTPLQGLTALKSLECSGILVSDLTPLQELKSLRHLYCGESLAVSDLTPLQGLKALRSLYFNRTSVSDLTSLKGLNALESLDCSESSVSDLTPLQESIALQSIYCDGTAVSDLTPLEGLPTLLSLSCGSTAVSDLTPLRSSIALQSLYCGSSLVSDLTPLEGLKAMQSLYLHRTAVSDLTPLEGLIALETLYCSYTAVVDLMPLQGCTALQSLHCGSTSVSDLTPLRNLTALERLDISNTRIKIVDSDFLNKTELKTLIANDTELQGFPSEVLSQEHDENCLPAIRAHLADMGNDPMPLNQVKLMVLGNGRIGKTQICNRLRNLPYEDTADSTHGITVTQAPIPGGDGTFAIWDFGGQDIYHGTHALFLKSRAVFMLVWTPDADNAAEHKHNGMHFRNQPLSWWLDYVKRFGSEQCPLIVVQNQLDNDRDRGDHPAVISLRDTLSFCSSLAYSAATNEGREVLNAYLKSATMRFNPPLIGRGRLRVMEQLIQMREIDAALPADERSHRTLPLSKFESICDESDNISNKRKLLHFLHNAGVVFWRERLFDDQIVLDQAWVLDAIYTVFNREKCIQSLRLHAGRFTRQELGWLVWDEHHSQKEQDLFISFMLSCRICFEISKGSSDTESSYVAPDLLPDNWLPAERAERWGEEPAEHERLIGYESLPPALLRNLICRIGEEAGIRCDYWRDGFYGFEVKTSSRVLLEQRINDDWRGEIRIQTRGGRARELLDTMIGELSKEEQRIGLTGTELSETRTESITNTEAMSFGDAPDQNRTFYVSYAWAELDGTSEYSPERIVKEFCNAAAARDIKIHRDRHDMQTGQSINAFMSRLARADRVIVVLSDKYLKSPFCMQELHGIWLQSRAEGERFVKRVRIYTEKDANIWTIKDRAEYAVHWKNEYQNINSIVQDHGINVLGDRDKLQLGLMQKFATEIGDILGELTDVLQPRSLDELISYSFEDNEFDDA